MTKTIGFIGSGLIGAGIAKLAINSGYKVVLSNSRGPETLEPIVQDLGDSASSQTTADLVSNDDIKIIVLSVPLKVIPRLFEELQLKNKIILDTSNYYPFRDNHISELDDNLMTTSTWVSQWLEPSNKLVKVFNNIDAIHLRISATQDPSKQTILPIAGDHPDAREVAALFLKDLGYKSYDAGSLEDSWKFEPRTPVYLNPYLPDFTPGLNTDELKKEFLTIPSPPLTEERLKNLLEWADRVEPVGGSIETTPEIVLEVMIDWYKKASKAKSRNSTVL